MGLCPTRASRAREPRYYWWCKKIGLWPGQQLSTSITKIKHVTTLVIIITTMFFVKLVHCTQFSWVENRFSKAQSAKLIKPRLIETSLKFTQIIRILVLVTPLGCHPIGFSCCVIRKNAKTYYHSYVIILGATDMFCHKNALLLHFLMKQVSFPGTIHCSDTKSVTSNCWYGKLNIQSMPITRTLANLNCCCFCCCCCCQPFTSCRSSSVLQHSTLSEKALIWRILI